MRERVGQLGGFLDSLKINSRAVQTDREIERPPRIGLDNKEIRNIGIADAAVLNFFDDSVEWRFAAG
ncbi:hypothetical protein [Bradyrhizobium cenepequi]|uniref:hypothetical protein n=1 Tax=Bradyrhizobium cenepequi TaxID=2821403 RepID=UPI001CE256BB|nr:hypothetical protein [Bradyrhizobium cenepequi]MCA6107320.1 hypothetical protein [Bradyrhizobium cenepequi]